MHRWYLKAATQRLVGLLPYRDVLHEGMQHYFSKSIRLNMPAFEAHLERDQRHLDHYTQHAGAPAQGPTTLFEVGTGWHPIFPIVAWLAGAERVWTVDVVAHLNTARVRDTLSHFVKCHAIGALTARLKHVNPKRLRHLEVLANDPSLDCATLLAGMNIVSLVADGAYRPVPDHSVDLIVSNVALEYVSPNVLPRMSREFRRMIRNDGIMSHDIDMQDQYSYGDRSISSLNFLKYSPRAWAMINNPFIPLNRLRSSDYQSAFAKAGFDVSIHDAVIAPKEDVARIKLAEQFAKYESQDLRTLRGWYIATPTAPTRSTSRQSDDQMQPATV